MAARDDAGARKAQHDKEVRDLQTQVSFLEEEISVLRRKLAALGDRQSGLPAGRCTPPQRPHRQQWRASRPHCARIAQQVADREN